MNLPHQAYLHMQRVQASQHDTFHCPRPVIQLQQESRNHEQAACLKLSNTVIFIMKYYITIL